MKGLRTFAFCNFNDVLYIILVSSVNCREMFIGLSIGISVFFMISWDFFGLRRPTILMLFTRKDDEFPSLFVTLPEAIYCFLGT